MKVRVLMCLSVSTFIMCMQNPQLLSPPTLTKIVPFSLPATVSFTPDGTKTVISSSSITGEADLGHVYIYDSNVTTQIAEFGYPYPINVADISPNSQNICLINDRTSAQIVSVVDGKVIATLPDQSIQAATIQYDKGGKRLLIASPNGVYLFTMETNQISNIVSEYSQNRVAYFNPANNDVIAVAQELGNSPETGVQLWDLKARKATHTFKPRPEPVYQLAFNTAGDKLVCGQVSYLSVWDTSSGQETELLNGAGKLVSKPTCKKWGAVQSLAFIPDKNIFFAPINSAQENGSILICDIDAPQNNMQFGQRGQDMNKCINSIAVRPDGQTLLAARELANDVCVWDILALKKNLEKEKPLFLEL